MISVGRTLPVVSRNTLVMDYAEKRQLFLIEQGYTYTITEAE